MKNDKNFLSYLFIFAMAVALQFNVSTGPNFRAISTAHAQTTVVISDTLFNPADWSVQDSSQFGASQTNMQELTGGNGGAFRSMQHILPPPPGSNDLGSLKSRIFMRQKTTIQVPRALLTELIIQKI